MNRKVKVPLSFILGLIVGLLPAVLLTWAFYSYDQKKNRVYQESGMPYIVAGPRTFGNVEIIAVDNLLKANPTNEVMGVNGTLAIQREGQPLVGLLFDKDKRLFSVSIYPYQDADNSLLTFDVSKTSGEMGYLKYGTLKSGINWYDLNCDGIFDLQFREWDEIREILLDNEWVAGTKKTGFGKATVIGEGGDELPYTFDFQEGKWVPGGES